MTSIASALAARTGSSLGLYPVAVICAIVLLLAGF